MQARLHTWCCSEDLSWPASEPSYEGELAAAAFPRTPALESPASEIASEIAASGSPAAEPSVLEMASPAKAAAARSSSGCGSRGSAPPSPRASRSSAHSAYLRGARAGARSPPGC